MSHLRSSAYLQECLASFGLCLLQTYPVSQFLQRTPHRTSSGKNVEKGFHTPPQSTAWLYQWPTATFMAMGAATAVCMHTCSPLYTHSQHVEHVYSVKQLIFSPTSLSTKSHTIGQSLAVWWWVVNSDPGIMKLHALLSLSVISYLDRTYVLLQKERYT